MAKKLKINDKLIYIMPPFVHEFGDGAHHTSMIRTCEFGENGPIPGTGPSDRRYFLHVILDQGIFYPIATWLTEWGGRNFGQLLMKILCFFWGLNCGFPPRDVALYSVWAMRGFKPIAVYKKIEGKWVQSR